MSTATAGSMIADLMRSLGYKEMGKNAPLRTGSIAKSGHVEEKIIEASKCVMGN
jgi:hypothetical protein